MDVASGKGLGAGHRCIDSRPRPRSAVIDAGARGNCRESAIHQRRCVSICILFALSEHFNDLSTSQINHMALAI